MQGMIVGTVVGSESWPSKDGATIVCRLSVLSGLSIVAVNCPEAADYQEGQPVAIYGTIRAWDKQLSVRDALVVCMDAEEFGRCKQRIAVGVAAAGGLRNG